jgi:hypothetical protein
MTIKALYPNVRPSLNLDFAKTKALDPRVTFTRASTGTFVGSNGLIQTAASGAARFDQNYATGESLGLLVEEARTNYMTQSSNFASWNIYNATVATSSILAPDGVSAATLLTDDTSTATHAIAKNYNTNPTSPQNVGISFFVKRGTARYFYCSLKTSSPTWAISFDFDNLSNWSKFYYTGTDNISIQLFPNGWYRISFRGLAIGGSANTTLTIGILDGLRSGNTSPSYTGDSTRNIYVWGAQAEWGDLVTSYIPTSGSTVTRAADVATLANTGSSIFPTSAFTTVNSPFGTAGGGSTVKLVGPTVKRTAVYNGDLTQAQINALAGVNDEFWRWRVLGSSFALPNFSTNGSVTVDWGDGVVETMTTAVHTFTNGGGYHDIGFRLNSGTFFKPNITDNATYKTRVIATGPAPASMKVDAIVGFYGCSALRSFDATLDATGGTSFYAAWASCSNLVSFPLVNTAAVTNFQSAWNNCTSLTSFPLINTAAGTIFRGAWGSCSSLTSFPLIDTAAGTNFYQTWYGCSSLTSFPLIDTAAGTDFSYAWYGCSSLTSFPLINTAAGTNFNQAWRNCSSLTSFPLIDTSSGTSFGSPTSGDGAWRNCTGLTSFPLLDFSSAISLAGAWASCTGLTSFPAINTASVTSFGESNQGAWQSCSSLTSFPCNQHKQCHIIGTSLGGLQQPD